jgi:hypothetical protein
MGDLVKNRHFNSKVVPDSGSPGHFNACVIQKSRRTTAGEQLAV